MNFTIIILTFGLSITSLFAADGILKGRVTDFGTRDGIPGALIDILGPDQKSIASTVTDADGNYLAGKIRRGPITIHYRKAAYKQRPTERTAVLYAEEIVNVELFKENPEDDSYYLAVAKRIQMLAEEKADGGKPDYEAAWKILDAAGLPPHYKAKAARALKQSDRDAEKVSKIKAYMDLSPDKAKEAELIVGRSFRNNSPILLGFNVPEPIKIDLVKHQLSGAQTNEQQRVIFLRNVKQAFGTKVYEVAIETPSAPNK